MFFKDRWKQCSIINKDISSLFNGEHIFIHSYGLEKITAEGETKDN